MPKNQIKNGKLEKSQVVEQQKNEAVTTIFEDDDDMATTEYKGKKKSVFRRKLGACLGFECDGCCCCI